VTVAVGVAVSVAVGEGVKVAVGALNAWQDALNKMANTKIRRNNMRLIPL
jgi:hypothetical protein